MSQHFSKSRSRVTSNRELAQPTTSAYQTITAQIVEALKRGVCLGESLGGDAISCRATPSANGRTTASTCFYSPLRRSGIIAG